MTGTQDLEPNLDEIIDVRFGAVEAELFVIEEYWRTVERQLPGAINNAVLELEDEITGADDLERPSVQQWIRQYAEEDLPRLFRAPTIVALWAVFEAAIIEIAEDLRRESGNRLVLGDLRGETILVRAAKYYEHVLKFPLIRDEQVKSRVEMLLLVRNVLAHVNGRVEAIKPQTLKKINSWESHGISTDYRYLTFTAGFVEEQIEAVKAALEDLIERVKGAPWSPN